jgi:hypothetical protein
MSCFSFVPRLLTIYNSYFFFYLHTNFFNLGFSQRNYEPWILLGFVAMHAVLTQHTGMSALTSGVPTWRADLAQHPVVATPSERCMHHKACSSTKTRTDHFLLNYLFNAKCIPSLIVFAILCGKNNSIIILLQPIILYI